MRHDHREKTGLLYAQRARPPADRGAVVDMLADGLRNRVTCGFWPVTITAGHGATMGEDGGLRVPKKELVGSVQVLLQARRLRVARALPDAPVLVKELENFRVKVTAARNEVYESWREGQHDDLVLAVALAAWAGDKALPPLFDPPREPLPAGLRV
jgi:hypothetical protein